MVEDVDDVLYKQLFLNFVGNAEHMKTMQKQDDDFKHMYHYLEYEVLPNKSRYAKRVLADSQNYLIGDDGLLYHLFSSARRKTPDTYIMQLCLPKPYQAYVAECYHDSLLGSHRGSTRLFAFVRQRYFWPGMQTDLADYVKTCQDCRRGKRSYDHLKAPMELRQIYPILYHIHMDVVSLPKDPNTGKTKCLVMIDSFSSYVELVAIPDAKAETLAKAFFQHWICRFSVPVLLTTDRHQSF